VLADGPGLAPEALRAACGIAPQAETPNGAAEPAAGLGPAAVSDIVRQCWGYAHEVGAGDGRLAVRFCFPAPGPEAMVGVPRRDERLPRGTETILLAEDDDSVRVVVAEVLRDLGYRVLEARDGREATDVSIEHDGPIDALVADLRLPAGGGQRLRAHLSGSRPPLRALFLSGALDSPETVQALADAGESPLSKPFSPWALASRLRQVLDTPQAPARTA
jgi:CheY-like chemotaxis protein